MITVSPEQLKVLRHLLGNRTGLELYGFSIGEPGPITLQPSDTLKEKIKILNIAAKPDRSTDRTTNKPIWSRPPRANPTGKWGP